MWKIMIVDAYKSLVIWISSSWKPSLWYRLSARLFAAPAVVSAEQPKALLPRPLLASRHQSRANSPPFGALQGGQLAKISLGLTGKVRAARDGCKAKPFAALILRNEYECILAVPVDAFCQPALHAGKPQLQITPGSHAGCQAWGETENEGAIFSDVRAYTEHAQPPVV